MCIKISSEKEAFSAEPVNHENVGEAEQQNPLTSIVSGVIKAKETKKTEALDNPGRYSPLKLDRDFYMVGGDIFNGGYTLFTSVTYFKPSLSNLSWMGLTTSICGEVGGVINVLVGGKEISDAFMGIANGDSEQWWNVIDGFLLILVGITMFLVALSFKVAALGGLAGAISQPWVLPLLFFLMTLPYLCKYVKSVNKIHCGEDLGSKLHLNHIQSTAANIDWEKQLKDSNLHEIYTSWQAGSLTWDMCSDAIQKLQDDIGVEAAIEVFKLLEKILQGREEDDIYAQIVIAREKIKEWHNAMHFKLLQQIFFILAGCISAIAFCPKANSGTANGCSSLFLAAPNAQAIFMDIHWPFKRNILTPVERV